QVEKRLELVKQVSHSTHKKLTACLQGQQGVDVEKRSKKLPLTTLAQCLVEGAAVLGDDSLLGKMLKLCGETQEKMAQELILFEFTIDRDVVDPLYELAEVEIPNIQKQRKQLAKLVLDMDSARTRFHQSSKSGMSSNVQPGAKGEHLREEMEEAANRMEICRDQLSADMYNFVAKEIDYASYFQALIEVQAQYHSKSLELLQNILPQIKAHQETWVEKPCYGKPLEEHLALSGRDIAFPIEACVTMLLECGMQEEGLFRVAPSASKLKKLKASLDCGVMDVQEYSVDPHAIAGALKSYLRELPEPLMTFELYDEWIQASNIQDQDKRLQALLTACEKLPLANGNNFKYLVKFLAKLDDYQDENKMTPGNIAIVLGPNLLWTTQEGNITEMMTTVSLQIVGIIEPIIQHADCHYQAQPPRSSIRDSVREQVESSVCSHRHNMTVGHRPYETLFTILRVSSCNRIHVNCHKRNRHPFLFPLSQRLSLMSQETMAARSTPITTPTTAPCPLRIWTIQTASTMIRADAHSVWPPII
uniref:Rho GTPase-activating protein 44 n=1 Tax=Oncorhynchus tshawytscha TaxID=74940 RepID=A0A8C8IDV3_ONCTS